MYKQAITDLHLQIGRANCSTSPTSATDKTMRRELSSWHEKRPFKDAMQYTHSPFIVLLARSESNVVVSQNLAQTLAHMQKLW